MSTALETLDTFGLLRAIGVEETETVSVCRKGDGPMTARFITLAELHGKSIPTDCNVFHGVNPVRPGLPAGGRGTAADVTRIAALVVDLDIKPGACRDLTHAQSVIDELSRMLNCGPVAVVNSGHGLHAYWALESQPFQNDSDRPRAQALLRRWGRLVRHVAEKHGAAVDSVFDLARVLRSPGSMNVKDAAHPLPVTATAGDGHPLDLAELDDLLNEWGAVELPEDLAALDEVVCSPDTWTFADQTCIYARKLIDGWMTDTPQARHPWLLSQATRLAALHAHGCITQTDHAAARQTLSERFTWLVAHREPVRSPHLAEVAEALSWGVARAATMTDQQRAAELGNHPHLSNADPFGTGLPPAPPVTAVTAGSTALQLPAPTPDTPPVGVAPAAQSDEHRRRLTLTPASAIKPRRTVWIWEGRIARGTLALLAGREGLGKSTVAYWIAARVTRGELPGEMRGTPAGVLVCATEDSWEQTILPRLIAAGADLDRVYRVEVLNADDIHVGLSLPRDIHALERSARDVGASLLILDPLTSRLGDNDTHKDSEVRSALEPLVTVAEKSNMAIIGLMHHNKSGSSDPLQLVMGSRAFTAVARSVHTVVLDPDDETDSIRLFGTPKNNLGRTDLPVLSFTISGYAVETDDGTAWTGAINWGDEHKESFSEVMSRASDTSTDRSAVGEAADWLNDFLISEGGIADSAEIKRAGSKAGHSYDALKRARKRARVEFRSEGFPRKTVWLLPIDTPADAPTGSAPPGTVGATGGSNP